MKGLIRSATVLIAGLLFGWGLALSGMTDPQKVLGFLDVAGGDWDPTLVFVMGGALGSYALLMRSYRRWGAGRGWFGTRLPEGDSGAISRRLLVGAALFGAGWGLAGFCPGPALANLVAWRVEALVFVPMMAIGMVCAQRVFGADR